MKRGTIVLTPFPFSDLHGSKVRPALVISPDNRRGNDVLIAFISSVVDPASRQETDLVINPDGPGFELTGLKVPSVLKLDKLATVHRNIILGELGELAPSMLPDVFKKLRIALDL